MGLHLSFAGIADLQERSRSARGGGRVALDRVLVETDRRILRRSRCAASRKEPANVVHTAGLPGRAAWDWHEELAKQTTRNARRLFGFAGSRLIRGLVGQNSNPSIAHVQGRFRCQNREW